MDICVNSKFDYELITSMADGFVDEVRVFGVWVYSGISSNSMFEQFTSLREALIQATQRKSAKLLFRGFDIKYGLLDEQTAYYINPYTTEMQEIRIEI